MQCIHHEQTSKLTYRDISPKQTEMFSLDIHYNAKIQSAHYVDEDTLRIIFSVNPNRKEEQRSFIILRDGDYFPIGGYELLGSFLEPNTKEYLNLYEVFTVHGQKLTR